MTFGQFYEVWRSEVAPTLPTTDFRKQYLHEVDGSIGFELLDSLTPEEGNTISMIIALAIEDSLSQSHTLTKMDFALHRMIHDRHMIHWLKGSLGDDYNASSTERALFMIYHRIPLIWIFSGFNLAKNRIVQEFTGDTSPFEAKSQLDWVCAVTTLLSIELNSIARVYSRFGLKNKDTSINFDPPTVGHKRVCLDLGLQDRNSQIAPPQKKPHPALELF